MLGLRHSPPEEATIIPALELGTLRYHAVGGERNVLRAQTGEDKSLPASARVYCVALSRPTVHRAVSHHQLARAHKQTRAHTHTEKQKNAEAEDQQVLYKARFFQV